MTSDKTITSKRLKLRNSHNSPFYSHCEKRTIHLRRDHSSPAVERLLGWRFQFDRVLWVLTQQRVLFRCWAFPRAVPDTASRASRSCLTKSIDSFTYNKFISLVFKNIRKRIPRKNNGYKSKSQSTKKVAKNKPKSPLKNLKISPNKKAYYFIGGGGGERS